MIALLLAVVLSVVNGGEDWRIQFSSSSLTVGVEGFITCRKAGKLVWQAAPYAHLSPDVSEVVIHRETKGIPVGAECVGEFEIKYNNEGGQGDPIHDYTGESARISWTEK